MLRIMFCIIFHACSDFVSPILSAATRPTRSAIALTATCVFITVVSSSLKFSRRTVRSSFSRDDGRTRSSNETVVWPICTRSVCVRLAINNRQQQTTGVRTRIRSAVECVRRPASALPVPFVSLSPQRSPTSALIFSPDSPVFARANPPVNPNGIFALARVPAQTMPASVKKMQLPANLTRHTRTLMMFSLFKRSNVIKRCL